MQQVWYNSAQWFRQVPKNSEQRSPRICNNMIVTGLSEGDVMISQTVAIFVDGPEPNLGLYN